MPMFSFSELSYFFVVINWALIGHFDLDPNRVFDIVIFFCRFFHFFVLYHRSIQMSFLIMYYLPLVLMNRFWIALKLNEIMTCYSMLFLSFPRFEMSPCVDIFFPITQILFSWLKKLFDMQSHAPQILGFKFQYYQRLELNCPVPSGLYKLSALLVKEDFINLESM